MSGFIDNRASEASEPSGALERMLTWHACRAMLPLVSRIAQDITLLHERLTKLRPELAYLDENRRQLDWPKRARRYHLEEEIRTLEGELRQAMTELESLGVALLEPATGLVGFPTLVNERRAYFSWQPGEETVAWWNYATDRIRRPVEQDWTIVPNENRPRRSRSRKK